MSATAAGPATAKAKRYACLWTDQVNKKHKSYQDGYVRHHHYNNRLYLLSSSHAELSSTFYSSHKPLPLPLPDTFLLEEGDELEFDGFIAIIEAFEFETDTDVSNLRERAKKPSEALAWGKTIDDSGTPLRPSPGARSSPSTSGGVLGSLIGAKPAYKGFGIQPPSNYTPGVPLKKRKSQGSPPPAFPKPLPPGGRPATAANGSTPQKAEQGTPSKPTPVIHSNQRFPKGHPNHAPPGFSPYSKPAPPPSRAPMSTPANRQPMSTPRSVGPVRTADQNRALSQEGTEEASSALKNSLKLKELGGVSTPSKGAISPFKMPRPGGGAGASASGTPSRLGRG